MVALRVLTDPSEFASLAAPRLGAMPAEHTVVATTLDDVLAGARSYPGAQWIVASDGADVAGLAMWTPPHPPYFGPMPMEAAAALGGVLADQTEALHGINGEADAVRGAVTAYQRRHPSRTVATTTGVRLHELGALVQPATPGVPRTATFDDWDLVLRWHRAFADDVAHPATGIEEGMRLRLERGALVLWVVEGQPVSIAGRTGAVAGVSRVGPVYTPPEQRGHGYGSAVTAEASRRARTPESPTVVLFTDLANPTSNKIYAEIGYHPVRDYLEVGLAASNRGTF